MRSGELVRPLPGRDVWLICAVLVSVVPARNLRIKQFLHGVRSNSLKSWNTLNHVHRQTEAVNLVLDRQLQGCIDIALFFITADVHVVVIRSTVSKAMDQPRISMKVKDDWFVDGEERIEILIRQAVRMFRARLQLEKINYIDVTDLEIREFFSQQRNGRQCFLRWYITSRSHHHIWFAALIVTCLTPGANPLGAVCDCRIHVQVLQMHLFVADDYVDVVFAPQAMVCH